jgi:hypothetical protein
MSLMMEDIYRDFMFLLWSELLHVSYLSFVSFSSICIGIA